jgi:hypothetical protein
MTEKRYPGALAGITEKNGTLHPAIKRGTLDDTFFVIPGSDPESMMIPFLLGRWSYICTHPQKRDPGAEAGMKEK